MSNKFENAIDRFSISLGDKIAWLYVGVVAVSMYEIFMRYLFNNPTEWVHETVTYTVGLCVIVANNYCMSKDLHMRVDLIYSNAKPMLKFCLKIFNNVAMIVLFALMGLCVIQNYGKGMVFAIGGITFTINR